MEPIQELDNSTSIVQEELGASGSTLHNFFNESILDITGENGHHHRSSPIHWAPMSK